MRIKLTFPGAALCGALAAASAAPAAAQSAAPTATIEAGVLHHTLSGDYGTWNGQFLRGWLQTGAADTWNAELVNSHEFGDRGSLLVLGNSHQFDERWYSSVSVAASSGGFFFPHARVDLSVNRKWLQERNLVSTLSFTAVDSKDGHRDRNVLLAMSYYFDSPWVIQGGIRVNRSNPGQVVSNGKYLALTYGRSQQQMLSLNYGFGSEAYQYVGPSALLVGFKSKTLTATWRKWIRPRQGFQIRAEAYSNPFYDRRGIELSAFQEF